MPPRIWTGRVLRYPLHPGVVAGLTWAGDLVLNSRLHLSEPVLRYALLHELIHGWSGASPTEYRLYPCLEEAPVHYLANALAWRWRHRYQFQAIRGPMHDSECYDAYREWLSAFPNPVQVTKALLRLPITLRIRAMADAWSRRKAGPMPWLGVNLEEPYEPEPITS